MSVCVSIYLSIDRSIYLLSLCLQAAGHERALAQVRHEAEQRGLGAETTEGISFNDGNAKRARTVCRVFEAGILARKGLCGLMVAWPVAIELCGPACCCCELALVALRDT